MRLANCNRLSASHFRVSAMSSMGRPKVPPHTLAALLYSLHLDKSAKVCPAPTCRRQKNDQSWSASRHLKHMTSTSAFKLELYLLNDQMYCCILLVGLYCHIFATQEPTEPAQISLRKKHEVPWSGEVRPVEGLHLECCADRVGSHIVYDVQVIGFQPPYTYILLQQCTWSERDRLFRPT